MPLMQTMSDRVNTVFSRQNMAAVAQTDLATGQTLREVMVKLNVATNAAEEAYLDSWPVALQEAILAVIRNAMSRAERVPVTISWATAYDFEVQVWEAHSTKNSATANGK